MISANGAFGIVVTGSGASGNLVEGNDVGTNVGGGAAVDTTAYQFSGGDVTLSNLALNSATTGATTTVSFWMDWNGDTSVPMIPFSFNSYDLEFGDNHFGFNTNNNDLYGISSSGLANQWEFVTAVFVNGSMTQNQIWINGVQQSLTQDTGLSGRPVARNVGSIAELGGFVNGPGYAFNGGLGQVAIFNGTLTSAQILAEYDAGASATYRTTVLGQSPAAYYPLTENDDSVAADESSGNGYTGSISSSGVTQGGVAGPLGGGNGAGGIEIINAPGNTIGGTAAGAGNVIAYNGNNNGVEISGSATANAIRTNEIFNNGQTAIALTSGATSPNPSPVFNTLIPGSTTTVSGTIAGLANITYSIDIFSNPSEDTVLEGHDFLGSVSVTTGGNGAGTFTTSQLGASQSTDEFTFTVSATNTNTTPFLSANLHGTSTTFQSSVNPSTYGQSVTLTATVVANTSGVGTPTGTVSFYDGSTLLGTATLPSSGPDQLTLTTTILPAGSDLLNANYNGDNTFLASNAVLTQTVNPEGTTTGVSDPTVTYNQHGLVTVTVNSIDSFGGTPSGSVTLTVDGGSPLSQSLNNGSYTFDVGVLNAGDHNLSASYTPTSNYTASSSTGSLHVNPAATSVGISAPTVTYNANGSVTLTVSSAAGTPSGNVSLSVDGGTAQTAALDGNGHATFPITSPSAGSHTLSASYAAQGNFAASSASGSLSVNPAPTSVGINAPQITYNADGTVIVAVSAASGVPTLTGSITLTVDGDSADAQTQALSEGQATFTLTSPLAGDHTLSAAYTPAPNYAATSATGSLHVNPAPTTTAIDASTVIPNENSTVTVTVSAPGVPVPTGSVTLQLDNGNVQTATLDGNGQATFTITGPGTGNHTLIASYAAQGNYAASSSTITVYSTQVTTSVGINAPAVTYNANGTVTLTVRSTNGTPSGDVSLTVDSTNYTATLDSNGTATFSITSPSAGSHTLSASYAAQGNFAASSASGSLSVNPAPTSVSINAPQITYNADGTITVAVSAANGVPTPSGSVTLTVDGESADAQTVVLDNNGQAAFTLISPSADDHSLSASYAPTSNYAATSSTGSLHVNAAPTSVGISAPTITYNSDGSVTVSVSAAAGVPTPTGSVVLIVDGTTTLTHDLSGGSWTFTIGGLHAGNHTLSASYAAQGNYAGSTADGTLVVNKTDQIITWATPGDIVYGTALSATQLDATVSGVPSGSAPGALSYNQIVGDILDAGSHTLTVTAAATADYNATTASVTLDVDPATPGVTATTDVGDTYNGSSFAANATVTGFNGVTLASTTPSLDAGTLSFTYYTGSDTSGTNFGNTAPANAGTYTVVARYTSDSDNYTNADSAPVTFTIATANAVVHITPYTEASTTYDGTAHTAAGTATGVNGEDLSADLNLIATTHTNAGTYNGDAWTFHDPNGNYADTSGTVNDSIGQATVAISVTGYSVTYDATAYSATGTATGVGGSDLMADLDLSATAHTNADTYTDSWTFHDPNSNYADATGTVSDTINQASATISVAPYSVTYDATAHTATGTATGVGGIDLSADLDLSATTHTDAGTYNGDAWSFSDPSGNYQNAASTVDDEIGKASSTTTTVGAGPFTYNGSAEVGGSGTVTGVGGLSTSATSLTYSANSDGTGTADQTDAGTYFVTAHYSGDANHFGSDGVAVAITIGQASSTTTTVGAGPFTYTGSAQVGGSGTVTGAGGLSTSATSLTYSANSDGTGTADQTDAGTYYVTAHYAGDANHTASDGSAVPITIGKASSSTTTVGAGPFTYTGSAQVGGSGTVTGAGGLSTSATSLTYSANSDGTGTADQTDAGTYYVTAHYSGDANHLASDGSAVPITIGKATSATTTVGAGPFTYTGSAQVAGSGTVTGAGGLSTSATSLTYSANSDGTGTADQTDAGTYYVTAHYAGDANHLASDGLAVAIVIDKASSSTTTVGAGPFTYTGSAQIAGSGTVTGVGGLSTGAISLTYSANSDGSGAADQTDAGTYYVTAHYAGDANHLASDGSAVAITIGKASSSTTTVGRGTVHIYTGSAQVGGSGTVTGAGGLSTSATSLTYSANSDGSGTADQTDAGTYYVTAHYAGDANHLASDGSPVAITIAKSSTTTAVAASAAGQKCDFEPR